MPDRSAHTDAGAPAEALDQAVGHLLSLQDEQGWWKGPLDTNVTMDAEDLLLREFLGIRTPEDTAATAEWIRSQQRADGTWATFYGGPGDLSTTAEAYVALRLAGNDPEDPHLAKAATFVRESGGLAGTRVFTRLWLALFGQWSWGELPSLPPEVMFLPPWCPFNIYDFASWARQTIVALTVVSAHRPVRELPFDLAELGPRTGGGPTAKPFTAAGALIGLDRILHLYDRSPPAILRRAALRRAESWIVKRQEADGGWGGIQPPWVYSLIALHLQGYPLDHPVLKAGLAGLERFTLRDQQGRRLEACQSPVWDTALAVVALADAGLPAEHGAQQRASRWLLDEEIRVKGDWAVRRPNLEPSGWAFEFANDTYPDIDDTAEVILALRRATRATSTTDAAIGRGRRWVEGMQSKGGGWGAFDVDNTSSLVAELPFCDFGEVIDPPSADVTAHVLEMLADEPDRDDARFAAGVEWLLGEQEPDGCWFGRWGVNYVYGTGAAVPALVAAGVDPSAPAIRRAVAWLEEHQQADGGWGEDLRSYRDPNTRGQGEATPSQTAWALLALLAADERGEPTQRGVAWLVANQRADGSWDEPWFTGTGFPWDFSIKYHLYRQVFPIMALGRWVRAGQGAP